METLQKAIQYRNEGKLEESKTILIQLTNEHPQDAAVHYQCAWSHDVLGLEREAVPYYEKAIELGLKGEDAKGAFVGLGSTYRTIGEYEKSKAIFEKGLRQFPFNHAMKTFYAITLYNLGEHKKAMELLLTSLTETTKDEEITKYKRAIDFYANRLDEKW